MDDFFEMVFTNARGPIPEDLWTDLYASVGNVDAHARCSMETPLPWDAGIDLKDDKFVLTGGVGPAGYGYCTCVVPLKDAAGMYRVLIDPLPAEEGGDLFPSVRRRFEELGVEFLPGKG